MKEARGQCVKEVEVGGAPALLSLSLSLPPSRSSSPPLIPAFPLPPRAHPAARRTPRRAPQHPALHPPTVPAHPAPTMPAAVMTSISAKPVAATRCAAPRRSVRAMAAGAPSMVPDMDKRVS